MTANDERFRDALLTACVNSCTSFYSGFVIFTYLGYMAHSLSKDIENVASEGYGLVFQVCTRDSRPVTSLSNV